MNAPTVALTPAWSPRPYRDADDQAILDVLQGAFGKWPTVDIDVPPIEHLRWKLHSHVLAPEHHMIAEVNGVIASARSLLVQPVRFQGQPLLAFQPVDLAVAPQFQGLGLTRRLRLIELRKMRETYPATFAIKLYTRSWHPAARRLREQIVAHGYTFGNRMIALERPNRTLPAQDPTTAYTLRNVTAFDERIDAFWREASRPFAFAVDRTYDYLRWRYDQRAGAFMITLAEQGEQLLGYAVTRTSRNIGYVVDLIALPGRLDVARTLLSSALSSFARSDAATIECWLPTRHPYQPLLRELGFTRSERKLRFRYTPIGLTKEQLEVLRGADTPLHLTASDTDLV